MFIKSDSFSQVWPNLPSVTQALKWDNFDKCDPFSQIWPIWPEETHFAQCDS